MRAPPRLIVLSGGSGVGKSTLARELQQRLQPEPWLHFSVDTLLGCYPAAQLERANQHNDWSGIDVPALLRASHASLRALLQQGHRVIFDVVVMTERAARELLQALPDESPLLVQLHCDWEETRRRTLQRGDRSLAEAEQGFRQAGRHLEADLCLDSRAHDPAALAEVLRVALNAVDGSAWERNRRRYGFVPAQA